MNPLLQQLQAWLGPNAKAIRALMAPLVVVMILAMMVLPLPPFVLDLLFTFNIAMALMVMMVAAYTVRPLDFAAFPAVHPADDAAAPVAQRRLDARRAARRPHRRRRPRAR